jgi:uncharacterized protein (TIGR03437 family)
MPFRASSRNLLAVLFAISGNAQIEIRGSRLAVNQEPFRILAVAYRPVSGCLYGRDFPLMSRAGVNTVQIFGRPPDETTFWQTLEAANLYLLAGFSLDPYHDPAASLAPGSPLRVRILREFADFVAQFRAQRRLLAVLFGREVPQNYAQKFAGNPRDFYSLLQEAAVLARPTLVSTAVSFPGADVPDLAFWTITGPFQDHPGKPLLYEVSAAAWDAVRQVEEPEPQAAFLRALLRSLPPAGGIVREWADSSSERRGLFGLVATESPGFDALRPRPAFAVLAQEWGGRLPAEWPPARDPRLQPRGVVNSGSLAPLMAPGSLISFFGEDLADPDADLTSACVGGRPATALFVHPGQVNALLASDTPLGPAAALLYRAGRASNTVPVEVRPAAPGILDRGVLEAGKPCPVTATSGVRPGGYLEIYATGLNGAVPRAFLGSREVPVLYSGPAAAGLYQTNIRVPPDFPAMSPAGLRLFAAGVESNAYRIAVLGDAGRPRLSLDPGELSFVVQAGGPPQRAYLSLEGQDGFCDLVRFEVTGAPPGILVSVPVGFPGQRLPVTMEAGAQARTDQEVQVTLAAATTLAEVPSLRVRATVLPSRGDIPFRVVSGGGRAGLFARFEMAGRVLHEARGGGPGRGFHFVVLNGDTGILGLTRSFDTWLHTRAADDLADYLTALPIGTVVLGAIADEGTLNLTTRARTALREVLRSQQIGLLGYQDSWAIMSRVGAALPIAEATSREQVAVVERVLTF